MTVAFIAKISGPLAAVTFLNQTTEEVHHDPEKLGEPEHPDWALFIAATPTNVSPAETESVTLQGAVPFGGLLSHPPQVWVGVTKGPSWVTGSDRPDPG
ncbi:MAG: hypothetical protein ACREEC_04630, partial [Thermoplasmata archaeon]